MATIQATPVPASAYVTLVSSGGTPGQVVFVLRVDSAGTFPVRDSAEGLAWPASGDLTILDHEPRQGETTNYVLTDEDGVELASDTNVLIPSWGTWLKSPGLPFLNTKVFFNRLGAVTRPANRAVMHIEGSPLPVVHHGPRMAPAGEMAVAVLTEQKAVEVEAVLSSGGVVMFDADGAWGVPYRYVSIGDVAVVRPHAPDGERGLTHEARVFVLSDVVEVAAPIGPTQIDATWSWDVLAGQYGSWAAVVASFPTWADVAAGP